MDMEINEKELKLLTEVENGNLYRVSELIKEGVNINFQDSNGNTALHYAVQYGQFFVVKLLLQEGADINAENESFETPMDFIADENSPNIECITMVLQRHVVEKSFQLLETFLEEKSSDQKMPSRDSITTTEVSNMDSVKTRVIPNRDNILPEEVPNSDGVTTEEVPDSDFSLFEEVFKKEVLKKGDNIKSCLALLKDLDTETLDNEFTYKQANTFIHFLHLFSFCNLKIGELASRVENEGTNSSLTLKANLRLIMDVQNLLLHSPDRTFNLPDIGKIICFRVSVSTWFKSLIEFVECICTVLEGSNITSSSVCDITTFMKVPFNAIGDQSRDYLQKEWETFMLAIHDEEQWTEELSHKTLFNFLVNFAPIIEKDVTNFYKFRKKILIDFTNLDFKEIFRNIFHYKFDSHLEFIKFLNYKNAKLNKIRECLGSFKNLCKELDNDCTEFTYELANSFISLLDSLAFQGDEGCLIEVIEEYFTRCYSELKKDLILINKVKNLLCNQPYKKISLDDVGKVVRPGISLVSFCQNFAGYVEFVCSLLDDPDVKAEVVDITFFLQVDEDMGTHTNDKLMEETFYLVQLVQNQDDWTKEKTQEILFSFQCNISKVSANDTFNINQLRNSLMSTFRDYNDVPKILGVVCLKTVFKLRSLLFQYHYAKKIHVTIHESKKIGNNLTCELAKFEKYFEERYKVELDLKNHSNVGQEDCFNSKVFNWSVLPSYEEEAIKDLVNQFYKYLIILDDQEFDLFCYKYGRLEIENFLNLKLVKSSFPELYLLTKEKIKDNFGKRHLNLRAGGKYFEVVCKLYIENDGAQNRENENEIKEITDTVCHLRKIQKTFKLHYMDLITLFRNAMRKQDDFDLEKYQLLIQRYEVKEVEKAELEIMLKMVSKKQIIKVTFDNHKISVEAEGFICGLFATFESTYRSFQNKYDCIENAFQDVITFNCFLWMEMNYWKSNFEKNINFGKYLFTVFEHNKELKFYASNVTQFIIDEGLVNSLQKEDLEKLTESLLDESCTLSVVRMLDVTKEKDVLYDIILKKMPEINLKHLRRIFKTPKHAIVLLKRLSTLVKENSGNDGVIKLEKDVLELVGDIAYKSLIIDMNLEASLELLEICLGNETDFNKLKFANMKRLKANILCSQGDLLLQQNLKSEAVIKFEIALQTCLELKSDMEQEETNSFEHNAMFLLILSCIAIIYYYWNKNPEAHEAYTKLFYCIKNYVLFDLPAYSESPWPNVENEDEFFDIVKSRIYYDLCHYTKDASSRLDLVNIRTLMASRLIRIRWKEHNNSVISKELKLYTENLAMFKGLYKMLKLNELSWYECKIKDIIWKIGYMHINLYRVKLVINSNDYRIEIVRHMVEALRLYYARHRFLEKENCCPIIGLDTIFLTLHDLVKTQYFSLRVNNAMMRHLNAIKEPAIKILGIRRNVTYYRNLPST